MLNIIEINNFNAPELDVYARYTEAQLLNKDRPEDGLFIAESPKVIGRALDAGYIPISVLVEKKQMEENEETQEVLARFENTGTSIFTAEFAVLTQLTGFKLTRGMLCALKRRPLEDFRKLCEGKNCHFGRCDESNECRSNLSIGSSDAYGCGITDFRMQQSIVSKSIQSKYGNGVPDSMDIYSRR